MIYLEYTKEFLFKLLIMSYLINPYMKNAKNTFFIMVIGLLILLFLMPNSAYTASSAHRDNNNISRIVIDPGHGGKDPGAIGPHGEKEKDITLSVSKELATRLREVGYQVFITRKDDTFIPLEERSIFANKKKAGLFISVHVNANEKESLRGVETYFLNLTTDASALKVADRENAVASKSMSDLHFIIKDLTLNARINESSRFATSIQKSIISSLEKSGYLNKDHGVKQAPFYVLVGAQMPSILIETGFITNMAESKLLQKKLYQNSIVNGIISGINLFVSNSNYAYNNRTF
jgi:N-acetylmuramoyl-L-alanine amidase